MHRYNLLTNTKILDTFCSRCQHCRLHYLCSNWHYRYNKLNIDTFVLTQSTLALELPFINRLRPHHTAICHMRRMLPHKAPKQLNHSQLHKYNATKQHWQWKWQTKGKAERLNISTCLPLAAPVAEQHCRLEERNEHAEEWKEG